MKQAEAARAKEEAAQAKEAEAKEAKARAEAEKQALKEAEKKQMQSAGGFAPMAAPPSSLSGSKEARLAELLELYRADKITPQEYHTQRAKIIAEP